MTKTEANNVLKMTADELLKYELVDEGLFTNLQSQRDDALTRIDASDAIVKEKDDLIKTKDTEKTTLQSQKTALETEKAVLQSEKAALESEKAVLLASIKEKDDLLALVGDAPVLQEIKKQKEMEDIQKKIDEIEAKKLSLETEKLTLQDKLSDISKVISVVEVKE